MALIISAQKREFVIQSGGRDEEPGTTLPDVNPEFTPQQTLDYYIVHYPELTTATINGPEVLKDRVRYTFCPQLGTKG